MLSLSNGGMTAGQAGKYFAAEDYYLKGGESSQWLGRTAAELKLTGRVAEETFRNVAAGRTPDGSQQLVAPKIIRREGEQEETHRAGNDLTFSAPKSLSVGYAAGNHELKEIWDQAVESTMRYVEEHYSQYRTPGGIRNAGNLLAAKFDHVTSRALDPDVHSHVFLLNMARTEDGRWLANEPKNIYRDKISIGMLARQEAISLLREAGYQVYFTDREKFLFEIGGVTPEEIEVFSKRSAAIDEQVAQWIQEGKYPGMGETLLKQWAAFGTRDPKLKVAIKEIRQYWDGCFAEVKSTAREVLERIEATKSLRKDEELAPYRYRAPGDYPKSLATVINHTNLPTLKRQPGYREAKHGGDPAAAVRVVESLANPKVIAEIRRQIPEGAPVYIVPVLQKEGPCLNMLPLAYAERLAEDLGGEVWTAIHKVSGRPNTGASLAERLRNVQVFRGELPPENSIIVVADDTFTVGGTLTALIDHLAHGKNTILCATTLAVGRYGKDLSPTKELIDELQRRAEINERQFRQEFGYPLRSLTGAEIRSYLLSGRRGIDGARARFHARGSGTGTRGHETAETEEKELIPEQHPIPGKTAREVLKEASSFLTDKEVLFTRGQLVKTAVKISGGQHHISELETAIKDKIRFVSLGGERSGPNEGQEFLTTREMLKLETRNVAALRELPPFHSVTSRPEVEAFLKGISGATEGSLHPDQVRFLEAFKRGAASAAPTGFLTLTPGQREYVLNELVGEKAFAVTQGDPGTGKTFAFGVIERFNAEVLEPSGRAHHALNIAYTNKAALEMEKTSKDKAYTVDSFLNRFNKQGPAAFGLELEQSAPKGAQVVVRLDEASLVGGRQAEHLLNVIKELKARGAETKLSLIGDGKQLTSIQASPFFIHSSQLARKGVGDYTVMKEIIRQKDASLLKVARALNRDREAPLQGQNAVDALKMLKQQERVQEIPTYDDLVGATVRHYLDESAKPSPDPAAAATGKKQSVLIVTPLNADRFELNRKIREMKMEKGELKEGMTVKVFVPVEQGITVSGYQPGMTVIFTGEREKDGSVKVSEGVQGNGEGKVVSANLDQNKVKISFMDEKGQQTRSFDAVELARKSTLYREEERVFAAGDTIVCNKTTYDKCIVSATSGKKMKLRNAELGEIERVEVTHEGTVALVKLSEDRLARVNLDRYGPQHLDHGYVITIHKGEGTTVDSVIYFGFVRPLNSNEQKALQALVGFETTAKQFEQWNSTLSPYEMKYRLPTMIGEHAGTLSLVMVRDRQNENEQKGITVTFDDGKAMMEDAATRLQMRGEGMYWAKSVRAWVTTVTNDRAMELMTKHPLRDQDYLTYLKETLAVEPPSPSAETESPPLAEIDSSEQAERYGRTSYNAFNVALTRPRSGLMVFTNSWHGLIKTIQMVDSKTSTVKEAGRGAGRGRSRTVARGHHQYQQQQQQRPVRESAVKVGTVPPAPAVPQSVRELARELRKPR